MDTYHHGNSKAPQYRRLESNTRQVCWGILTIAQAFIKGRGGFYILGHACTHAYSRFTAALIATRLLIGLFEAGFYPTAVAYLSTFYTRFDLAVRIGLFYGQYAIAGAFSGSIGTDQ